MTIFVCNPYEKWLWPTVASSFVRFESSYYRVWGLLQEKGLQNTYQLIWTNWNSDWQLTEWAKQPSWITLSLRVTIIIRVSDVVDSSRSVMRVLYTISCNISHTRSSIGFKSGESVGHSRRGNQFWSFCNNSMVSHAQWEFRVSQGSVETLVSWGGKRLIILQQIYFGNYLPNVVRIARVL